MTIETDERAAAVAGARALIAEPRLAAAVDWRGRDALFQGAIEEIRDWPGIPPHWTRRAVAAFAALPPPRDSDPLSFVLELDGEAQTSLSLFVFRRLPWPTALGSIDLDRERLGRVSIGSAARQLAGSAGIAGAAPSAFPKNGCGRGQPLAAEPPRVTRAND
jgi:hypothetical protein